MQDLDSPTRDQTSEWASPIVTAQALYLWTAGAVSVSLFQWMSNILLKLNIQKIKIMASSPFTSWQTEGGKWK